MAKEARFIMTADNRPRLYEIGKTKPKAMPSENIANISENKVYDRFSLIKCANRNQIVGSVKRLTRKTDAPILEIDRPLFKSEKAKYSIRRVKNSALRKLKIYGSASNMIPVLFDCRPIKGDA
ncbi:hypothetical protein KEJ39_06380 [Candidatus Bathyarchaeota archaeon]|nr:hypothetical protein [Candidatus Bathyarchaeota archaeon]